RIEEIHAVGSTLARAAEAMLASDELSPVRLLVTDAAVNYDLSRCRIVLADGRVVADAEPARNCFWLRSVSHASAAIALSRIIPTKMPTEAIVDSPRSSNGWRRGRDWFVAAETVKLPP